MSDGVEIEGRVTRRRLHRLAALLALGTVACGAALAACGPFGGANGAGSPATGQPVRLTYLHQWSPTQGHGPMTDKLAAQFSAEHPTIEVKSTYTDDYYTKLATILAGGDLPDIVTYNLAWVPLLVKKGVVVTAESLSRGQDRLAAARQWAAEVAGRRGQRIWAVHCGAAPRSHVAAAAQYQEAAVHQTSWESAGPQVRTLNTFRLLKGIEPELTRQVRRHSWLPARLRGTVRVQAETGAALITVRPERVDVQPATIAATSGAIRELTLAQTTLIRLVLGALPARDLLARSEPQLEAWAQEWLVALFPPRQPYMYPLDRS